MEPIYISYMARKGKMTPDFVYKCISEIYSRIRVLTYYDLNFEDIHIIQEICSEIGFSELEAVNNIMKSEGQSSNDYNEIAEYLMNLLKRLQSILLKYDCDIESYFFLPSVTQWIKKTKQPKRGYVSCGYFKKIKIKSDKILLKKENIPTYIVGLAVDHLFRYLCTNNKNTAFDTSIAGAESMPDTLKKSIGATISANDLLSGINGTDNQSIISACQLCAFDSYYRGGQGRYKDFYISSVIPDENTVNNIRTMLTRCITFVETYGPITEFGFSFEGGYTTKIRAGDGDFLTEDTMWDLKVSYESLSIEKTLQLAIYWLMGKHSGQERYQHLKRIGIYNPRKDTVYIAEIDRIPHSVMHNIERDVIGYTSGKIPTDKNEVALLNMDAENIKNWLKKRLE